MTWIIWSALAVGVIVASHLALAAFGAARWAAATRVLLGRLEASLQPATVRRYDARELEGLPAPVPPGFGRARPSRTGAARSCLSTTSLPCKAELAKRASAEPRVLHKEARAAAGSIRPTLR